MKQVSNKKATAKKSGSPKNRESKSSKKSNQSLYIKILSATLAIVVLCFFAYFLTTKNDTKPLEDQVRKIQKQDGTQKTIDDINRYLQSQDKSSQALSPRPQEKLTVESKQNSKEQNSTKQIEIKPSQAEPIKIQNNQTKTSLDGNFTSEISNKTSDLNLTKFEPKPLKDQNQTAIKTPENNTTNLNQDITKQSKKPEKQEPKKQEKTPKTQPSEKQPEKKDKISNHKSEINASGAKLVIIIDDVATYQHANAIKSTGLKITPSIFPATKSRPDTPKIAKLFSFYMVHLPMQAIGRSNEEVGTLKINDSSEKIQSTLQSIKRDFENLKYINNHTGSRFTSDFGAMDRFMAAAKKEGIVFVDSKTIGETKVYEAAKKHGMRYIVRDVFLDHDSSKAAVISQLKYAVKLAKQKGYAIAIGHPYKNTMDVLRNAKEILNGVEVVYLRDIL